MSANSEQPSKLSQICVDYVCRNIDRFTSKSRDGAPFLRTPFTLPIVVIEKLLVKLNDLFLADEATIASLLHPSTCPAGLRRLQLAGSRLDRNGLLLATNSSHLVDVNLAFCRQLNQHRIVDLLLPSSHTLVTLKLCEITGDLGFDQLDAFTKLKDLDLCGTDIDASALEKACIGIRSSLEYLDVSRTSIRFDVALTCAAQLPHLRSLGVHGLTTKVASVDALRGALGDLKNLTHLDMSSLNCPDIRAEDVVSLALDTVSSLRDFDISHCKIPCSNLLEIISQSPLRHQLESLVAIDCPDVDAAFLSAIQKLAPQLFVATLKRDDLNEKTLQRRHLKRPNHLNTIFSRDHLANFYNNPSKTFWTRYGDLALSSMYFWQNDTTLYNITYRVVMCYFILFSSKNSERAALIERCLDFAIVHYSRLPLQMNGFIRLFKTALPSVRTRSKWTRRVCLFLVGVLRSSPSPPNSELLYCLHRLVSWNTADVRFLIGFELKAVLVSIDHLAKLNANPKPSSCEDKAVLLADILCDVTDGIAMSGDKVMDLYPDVDPLECATNSIHRFNLKVSWCVVCFLGNVIECRRGRIAVMKNPRCVKTVLSCLKETMPGDVLALSVCHFVAVLLSDNDDFALWLHPELPSRIAVCELLSSTLDRIDVNDQESRTIGYTSIRPLLDMMTCEHTSVVRYFALWMMASLCCSSFLDHYVKCLRENNEEGLFIVKNVVADSEKSDDCFAMCKKIILDKYSERLNNHQPN